MKTLSMVPFTCLMLFAWFTSQYMLQTINKQVQGKIIFKLHRIKGSEIRKVCI